MFYVKFVRILMKIFEELFSEEIWIKIRPNFGHHTSKVSRNYKKILQTFLINAEKMWRNF